MLADHLGTGDYAITRVVFVVLLAATTAVLVVAIRAAHHLNRVLAGAAAALFLITAIRMHQRWEDVTNAADRLAGPMGSDLQVGEIDRFITSVFGDATTFLLAVLLVAACVGAIHRRASRAT